MEVLYFSLRAYISTVNDDSPTIDKVSRRINSHSARTPTSQPNRSVLNAEEWVGGRKSREDVARSGAAVVVRLKRGAKRSRGG